MGIFNFGKKDKVNIELVCRQTGLDLHDRLVATEWKDIDSPKGQKPRFHKPYTRYDKKYGKCLLLTGYTFILEDEDGREEREVIKVIDVASGKVIEELRFGYGHEPAFGRGNRVKAENTKEVENEEMIRHKTLLAEFAS